MILPEKINHKCRVKFLRVILYFRENQVWKFDKYAWTCITLNWTRLNYRHKVILHVTISKKCRIQFFRKTFRFVFKKTKFENLLCAYTKPVLSQICSNYLKTFWKQGLKWKNFISHYCLIFAYRVISYRLSRIHT